MKKKILIIGGNRNFGLELIKKILSEKKIELFVINRRGKNLKKIENYFDCYHFNFDRSNQQKIIKIILKYKIDLVLDNIAYELSSIKKLLSFIQKNKIMYIFVSTVLTSFYLNHNFENKSIQNLVKKKFIIERYLDTNLTNFITLKFHNILSYHDSSNRTKSIIYLNKESFKNKKIKPTDKIQFIFINDLIKIVYNLILKKNLNKLINKDNVFHIANNYLSLRKLSFINNKSKIKRDIVLDNTILYNIIVKNDIIDKRIHINNHIEKKLNLLRQFY